MSTDSQYDKSCTTYSQNGTIPQISYTTKAVEQGTIIVGARSKKIAVIGGYRRTEDKKFAEHIEKLFKVDDHCGVAIAGLTADARVLTDYMRLECLNSKYIYQAPLNIGRLVAQIGDKCQKQTIFDGRRPYGVGLLVGGYDKLKQKACLYETSPTGDYYEYYGAAIGSRNTTAKTYLEKHYKTFEGIEGKKGLVKHVVKALYTALEQDVEISTKNIEIAVVGENLPYQTLSPEELEPYLTACANESGRGADDMEIDGDNAGDGFS